MVVGAGGAVGLLEFWGGSAPASFPPLVANLFPSLFSLARKLRAAGGGALGLSVLVGFVNLGFLWFTVEALVPLICDTSESESARILPVFTFVRRIGTTPVLLIAVFLLLVLLLLLLPDRLVNLGSAPPRICPVMLVVDFTLKGLRLGGAGGNVAEPGNIVV